MQQLDSPRSAIDPSTQKLDTPKLLLFDLAASGHHPVYIQYLVRDWVEQQRPGTLHVVVSPQFFDRHADITALAYETSDSRVQFTAISEREFAQFEQQKSLLSKSFAEWHLLCNYASQLQATQALLMYFDTCQIPLVAGRRAPCPIAGIYFRPTFHYSRFADYHPTWQDTLRQWRQKRLLTLILRNPQLKTLFSLDAFAVPQIQQCNPRVKVLPLADPVQPHHPQPEATAQLRQDLGIAPDRQVLLLFGELNRRKGIYQILTAMSALPPELGQQICLLLAGPLPLADKPAIVAQIQQLQQTTSVQVILNDQYIKGDAVQRYFELADNVLATYQRHVGMSSILLHAAAAQKPVLSTDYGLMGELVRHYELGLVVDASQPEAIAQGVTDWLQGSDRLKHNAAKMQEFVNQNLAGQFVDTILQTLLSV
ncbi:glycosyltransferase [Phormidesmis sp. 146-35]